MRHSRIGSTRLRPPAILFLFFVCGLLLISSAGSAVGQSGRKPPKRPSEPPPSSTQPAPPVTAPAPQDSKPRTPVMVLRYSDPFMSAMFPDAVIAGCLERLHEFGGLDVRTGKEMNRKEAIDFAKRSSDTYVVWIELQGDRMNSTPTSTMDASYARTLYVNYVVFAPGAEKPKTSGHVYQRNQVAGGVPYPGQTPRTTSSVEYSLKYAGRETADRVLDTLGLLTPGVIKN